MARLLMPALAGSFVQLTLLFVVDHSCSRKIVPIFILSSFTMLQPFNCLLKVIYGRRVSVRIDGYIHKCIYQECECEKATLNRFEAVETFLSSVIYYS